MPHAYMLSRRRSNPALYHGSCSGAPDRRDALVVVDL